MNKVRPDDTLESMNVLGIAPFFGPIDLSRGGEVTIGEATDSDVLTRASQQINENLEQPSFTATNLVTVTYMNVSTANSRIPNVFQAVIVGGRNKRGNEQTYVLMLYKNLVWSEGAEAGIMTAEKSNSIHLPGSGREGIEQLSQLSNVKSPGIWLYRIDEDVVFPCMQLDLQPPYCDAQSPTLVNNNHPLQSTPKHASTEVIKVSNINEQSNEPFAKETVAPIPTNAKPNPFTSGETSLRTRPSTQRQSTEHRPVVSLHPDDFTNFPDDAFAFTESVPFVTNIPQVFPDSSSSAEVGQKPVPSLVSPMQPRPPSLPPRFSSPKETHEVAPPSPPHVTQTTTEESRHVKPERPRVDFSNTGDNDVIEFTDTVQTIIPFTVASNQPSEKVRARI